MPGTPGPLDTPAPPSRRDPVLQADSLGIPPGRRSRVGAAGMMSGDGAAGQPVPGARPLSGTGGRRPLPRSRTRSKRCPSSELSVSPGAGCWQPCRVSRQGGLEVSGPGKAPGRPCGQRPSLQQLQPRPRAQQSLGPREAERVRVGSGRSLQGSLRSGLGEDSPATGGHQCGLRKDFLLAKQMQ